MIVSLYAGGMTVRACRASHAFTAGYPGAARTRRRHRPGGISIVLVARNRIDRVLRLLPQEAIAKIPDRVG
jgi:hypothetical protein